MPAVQKKSNNMMVQTSVPANVFAEVDARAYAASTTKATVVREILVQWFSSLKDKERLAPC
jgi:hypothetical protein